MFALIVRFQELTSYLSPATGYFGPIDGGESAVIARRTNVSCLFFCSVLFLHLERPRPPPRPPHSQPF